MKNLFASIIAACAILAASSAAAQTPVKRNIACKPAEAAAATVYGSWMYSGGNGGSGGDPSIVQYDKIVTNIGNPVPWDTVNLNQFIAPCAGTYVFTVSFVRDTLDHSADPNICNGMQGTYDDVYVELFKTRPQGGALRIGNDKGAWAGAMHPDDFRNDGTYTVATHLDAGQAVFSKVLSDGGKPRCLASANFTGYKVSK